MNKTLEERYQEFATTVAPETLTAAALRTAFMEGVLAAMEIVIGTDSSESTRNCLDLMTATRDFQNHQQ
jgi:hypothetical protein